MRQKSGASGFEAGHKEIKSPEKGYRGQKWKERENKWYESEQRLVFAVANENERKKWIREINALKYISDELDQ